MDLGSYLNATGMSHGAFAKRIGVTRQALHFWVLGKRMPRTTQLQSIKAATDGAVTPNDFLPDAPRNDDAR